MVRKQYEEYVITYEPLREALDIVFAKYSNDKFVLDISNKPDHYQKIIIIQPLYETLDDSILLEENKAARYSGRLILLSGLIDKDLYIESGQMIEEYVPENSEIVWINDEMCIFEFDKSRLLRLIYEEDGTERREPIGNRTVSNQHPYKMNDARNVLIFTTYFEDGVDRNLCFWHSLNGDTTIAEVLPDPLFFSIDNGGFITLSENRGGVAWARWNWTAYILYDPETNRIVECRSIRPKMAPFNEEQMLNELRSLYKDNPYPVAVQVGFKFAANQQ